MQKRVHVAVGVIRNSKSEVLIAKRADHLHQGGLWEFPGGKVESGETVQQALCRELKEELGIEPTEFAPLIKIQHDYIDKSVLLDVWIISKFSGSPIGLQNQPLQWVLKEQLLLYLFPAANKPIITALCLPREMMITGDWQDFSEFERRLKAALIKGIRLVQLRAHQASFEEFVRLSSLAKKLCKAFGALLIVNMEPEWFSYVDADGLHLTSSRLMNVKQSSIPENIIIGASCHNEMEIYRAEQLGANYITLGPVFETATHPEGKAMGMKRFEQLIKSTALPVFALGGVDQQTKNYFMETGVFGIAGIRLWWS